MGDRTNIVKGRQCVIDPEFNGLGAFLRGVKGIRNGPLYGKTKRNQAAWGFSREVVCSIDLGASCSFIEGCRPMDLPSTGRAISKLAVSHQNSVQQIVIVSYWYCKSSLRC